MFGVWRVLLWAGTGTETGTEIEIEVEIACYRAEDGRGHWRSRNAVAGWGCCGDVTTGCRAWPMGIAFWGS
jgi:hypothetical protein